MSLRGYSLRQQFEPPYGFILVTDCDCPFEEITEVALVSPDMRSVSCRWLGLAYTSFLLERIKWVDDQAPPVIRFGHATMSRAPRLLCLRPHAGRDDVIDGLVLALRWIVGSLRLHRVEASIQPANEPSRAMARRGAPGPARGGLAAASVAGC